MNAEIAATPKVIRAERLAYTSGYPVFLSRYVIFGGEERRVAMRFFNAAGITLTGIRFCVTERDAEGKEISSHILEARDIFIENGVEFPVDDLRIVVACSTVEAKILAVFSGDYEYSVEEDGVRLRYAKMGEAKHETYFLNASSYKVKKKRRNYFLLSLLSVAAFAVIAIGAAIWRGALGKVKPPISFEETAQVTEANVEAQ